MTHASLFSGIGGFDLAAEWMGWENLFHCEINPFGRKVLEYHFPQSKSYDDITKTDFTIWRGRVDVLTGGFPCQPYSLAGKRKGKEDERHLWPEMLRAIREIKPKYIVGENVPGIVSWDGGLVFEEVCLDLEAEGYEVQPCVLPAASVNAPHRRDRVWFVAFKNANKNGWRGVEWEEKPKEWRQRNISTRDNEPISSNNAEAGITPDTERIRQQRQRKHEQQMQSKEGGIRKTGRSYRSYENNSRRYERPNFESFPTQSPVCGGDDGIPDKLDSITFSKWRIESIKAYGNAIVPQVVYPIFKAIQIIDND